MPCRTSPNAYDTQFVKENAQYLEGGFDSPQFVPLEYRAPVPRDPAVPEVDEAGQPRGQRAQHRGWMRARVRDGPEADRPRFVPARKLIDALNRDTHFDANGMIVPIDWTSSRNPEGPKQTQLAQYTGKYICTSTVRVHDGKFVTTADRDGEAVGVPHRRAKRADAHQDAGVHELCAHIWLISPTRPTHHME